MIGNYLEKNMFFYFRIQLPDLRYVDCTVDFSVKTFNAGVVMCRDLGLR